MKKRRFKKEARVMGIDDAPFHKDKPGKVLVLGIMYRGGNYPDGLASTYCTIDGTDSTRQIAKMVKKSKFKIQSIMMKGIAVGGFNVIDAVKLHKLTKLPVIIIMRKMPKFAKLFDTMKNLGFGRRVKLIEQLPRPKKMKGLYVQAIGISDFELKHLLGITITNAAIPEPLRVAHIIASGLIKGESKGGA